MLVLRRRVQERIRCRLPDGRFGWITLVDLLNQTAGLGFEFPHDVAFEREEIIEEPVPQEADES